MESVFSGRPQKDDVTKKSPEDLIAGLRQEMGLDTSKKDKTEGDAAKPIEPEHLKKLLEQISEEMERSLSNQSFYISEILKDPHFYAWVPRTVVDHVIIEVRKSLRKSNSLQEFTENITSIGNWFHSFPKKSQDGLLLILSQDQNIQNYLNLKKQQSN